MADEQVKTESHATTLDYASFADRKKPAILRFLVIGLGVVALLATVAILFIPSRTRVYAYTYDDACRSNLFSLKQELMLYTAENHGSFPQREIQLIRYVVQDSPRDTNLFVCPGSNLNRASGSTTQEVLSDFDSGNHFSYIYTGAGLTIQSPPDAVLLYEPISYHGDHINVVFLDGHMARLNTSKASKLITELQSGHNPPRPEMLK